MKKKVYISSTLDLPEYRKAIEDTFRKYGKFFEVVRIAEYMTASTNSALEECLTDVESCDLYVLIIGLRYGSLAPGKEQSYTHCEYIRAMQECNPKKQIIAFYAADNIAGMVAEQLNPDKFTAFKSFILNTHLSNTSGFTSHLHLVTQLQDSLLLRVFENIPDIKYDAIEYKCNRTDAVARYRDNVLNCSLDSKQVIPTILYGTKNDKPKSFTDRLAKIEYEMKVKFSLPRSKYIDNTTQAKCRMNILRNIFEMLFPEDKNYYRDRNLIRIFLNTAAFFTFLSSKGIQELFIEFVIDLEEMQDTLLQTTLQEFFTELQTNVPQEIFVHFTLCIYGDKTFEEITAGYDSFKAFFTGIADIRYLKKVKREDIFEWIEINLDQQLPTKVNHLIDNFFQPGDFEMTMSEAQEKLQLMTNELNFKIVI